MKIIDMIQKQTKEKEKKMQFLRFSLQVKNRAPAKIQITAEQLILESTARQDDKAFEPPKQLITDPQVHIFQVMLV